MIPLYDFIVHVKWTATAKYLPKRLRLFAKYTCTLILVPKFAAISIALADKSSCFCCLALSAFMDDQTPSCSFLFLLIFLSDIETVGKSSTTIMLFHRSELKVVLHSSSFGKSGRRMSNWRLMIEYGLKNIQFIAKLKAAECDQAGKVS